MIPRNTFLFGAALSLALGPSAHAADSPDPKVREETVRLMRQGKDDFAAGRFESARALYERACRLMRTPKCVRSLATSELRAGRPLDAYHHFQELFANPETNSALDAQALEDARRFMKEADAHLAHIVIRAPAGASLTLDGQPVAGSASGDPIDVVPGTHVVEAHLGDRVARTEVSASAGTVSMADVHVDPAPVATAPPVLEPSPAPMPASPEIDHVQSPPTRWWTTRRWIGVAVTGAGVLSFVASGAFAADASSAQDQAASLRAGQATCSTSCSALENAYSRQDSDATLSRVFLGGGIAGVAVGAALILWPDARTPAQAQFVPAVTPHGGGLHLQGVF